jgi:pimeloyl-ACP methyl ester carboxylesterase
MGPQVLATEDRFEVGIFYSAGLASGRSLPEVDQINFVTRVRQPVLMLNGLRDSVEPYETAQKPMFDLLGTPTEDKRHVTFENTGHGLPHIPTVRETVDWLDRYLGVVERDGTRITYSQK